MKPNMKKKFVCLKKMKKKRKKVENKFSKYVLCVFSNTCSIFSFITLDRIITTSYFNNINFFHIFYMIMMMLFSTETKLELVGIAGSVR